MEYWRNDTLCVAFVLHVSFHVAVCGGGSVILLLNFVAPHRHTATEMLLHSLCSMSRICVQQSAHTRKDAFELNIMINVRIFKPPPAQVKMLAYFICRRCWRARFAHTKASLHRIASLAAVRGPLGVRSNTLIFRLCSTYIYAYIMDVSRWEPEYKGAFTDVQPKHFVPTFLGTSFDAHAFSCQSARFHGSSCTALQSDVVCLCVINALLCVRMTPPTGVRFNYASRGIYVDHSTYPRPLCRVVPTDRLAQFDAIHAIGPAHFPHLHHHYPVRE